MQRRLAIAGLAWAGLLLAIPVVLGPLDVWRSPEAENRAPRPAPDRIAPWDTDWFGEVTAWVEDRLALQGAAARALREFDLAITDRIQSEEVLAGEDGYLFLAKSLEVPCLEEVPRSAEEERLGAVLDGIEGLGARAVVMVVPDKIVAESHRAPVEHRGKAACLRARAAAVEDLLVDRLGDDAVPTLELLTTTPSSWFAHDTHWNPEGRLRALEALSETLRPGSWDSAVVTPRPAQRELDLRTLAGVPRTIDVEDHAIELSAPYEPRTIVLHDSYVRAWRDEFRALFADAAFVHYDDVDTPEVAALLGEVDTIVVETVGRQAWGRSARFEQLADVLTGAAGAG